MPTTHLSATSPFSRRRLLMLAGMGGAVTALAACGDDASSSPSTTVRPATPGVTPTAGVDTTVGSTAGTTVGSTGGAAAADDLTLTPTETGGPFPADGSNDNGSGGTADALHDARAMRADIRSDLDGSNVQPGVPFALTMNVVDDATGKALPGAAVYVWHCNASGEYSEYNSRMLGGDFSARSFLRGVQVADAAGNVTFQTILPGRYRGRAFHIHFEVYADSTFRTKLLTSQMAMDDALIDSLYSAAGLTYASALRNETTNAGDNVFSDGVGHQLLTVSGDVQQGLTATFRAVV